MKGERGSLVLAVMALVLLGALGASLAIIATTEMGVAGNFALAQEGIYAAEAGLQIVAGEVAAAADWDAIRAGPVVSAFVDGPPAGIRELADGSLLNLADITAGLDGPGWRLFAFGPLNGLQDQNERHSTLYVIVWVGGDSRGDPAVLALRAEAYAPGGTRRAVEARVSRSSGMLSWNEVR